MWKSRTRTPRGAVRFRCGEESHSQVACLIRLNCVAGKYRCGRKTDDRPASHLNQQSIIRLTLVFALFSPFLLRFHLLGSKSFHASEKKFHACRSCGLLDRDRGCDSIATLTAASALSPYCLRPPNLKWMPSFS
jgi:hypothetical protein